MIAHVSAFLADTLGHSSDFTVLFSTALSLIRLLSGLLITLQIVDDVREPGTTCTGPPSGVSLQNRSGPLLRRAMEHHEAQGTNDEGSTDGHR